MPLGTLVQFMLPRWVMTRIAGIAGRLVFRLNRRQRGRLADNCRHVLGLAAPPEAIHRTVLQTFINLVMSYLDLLRVPVLRRRVVALGDFDSTNLDRVLAQGRGAILVTPHLGNWDLAGTFLGAHGYPISAVVEPVPRGWARTFNRYRSATAMQAIPIPQRAAIARAVKHGRLLALVADRDLTGNGIRCPAFDSYRAYPKGAAAYSLKYGVPIVVGYFVFQQKRGRPPYLGIVTPPIEYNKTGNMDRDIPAVTHLVAHHLNELIARYPDQWPVFQAGWQR